MAEDEIQTVRWVGDAATGFLRLIDQTRLPTEFVEIDCRDVPAVWEAIKSLRVRGAPAIGVAAAYGAVLGARARGIDDADVGPRRHRARRPAYLRTSRPTAVNLFWALDRMDARRGVRWPRGDGPRAAGPAARRGPADRRRRPRHVPGDRPPRGGAGRARAGDPDPLQRRRPGHGRLRHGPGGHLRRPRAGHAAPRLRRRDPARCSRGPGSRPGSSSAAASPSP